MTCFGLQLTLKTEICKFLFSRKWFLPTQIFARFCSLLFASMFSFPIWRKLFGTAHRRRHEKAWVPDHARCNLSSTLSTCFSFPFHLFFVSFPPVFCSLSICFRFLSTCFSLPFHLFFIPLTRITASLESWKWPDHDRAHRQTLRMESTLPKRPPWHLFHGDGI